MKKLAALSLAAAALAMTSGCSMLPQAGPAPTVTVTAAPAPEPSTPEAVSTAGADAAPADDSSQADTPGARKTMWDYQQGRVSDEQFVGVVRDNTTTLAPYDSSMLVVLAQTTCADVANGASKADIVERQVAMAQTKQTGALTQEMGRDIGFLLGAGAKNYCPELSDALVQITKS